MLHKKKIRHIVLLVNIDLIFRGEGVELAKIGDNEGERELQELFKYQIRFSVASLLVEILVVKETPLFSVFQLIWAIWPFGHRPTCGSPNLFQNSSKRR